MKTKEWLNRGYRIDNEIETLLEEQQQARDRILKITGTISEDRVQTSRGNSTESGYIKYLSYSDRINEKINELYAVKQEIETAIESVSNPTYRQLLRLRYLKYNSFDKIAEQMNYSLRQIMRLHCKSLLKITDVIECHIPPVV